MKSNTETDECIQKLIVKKEGISQTLASLQQELTGINKRIENEIEKNKAPLDQNVLEHLGQYIEEPFNIIETYFGVDSAR